MRNLALGVVAAAAIYAAAVFFWGADAQDSASVHVALHATDSPTTANLPPLARRQQKGRVSATESEAPAADEPAAATLPWEDAKDLMRADFVLDDDKRERIRRSVFRLPALRGSFPGLTGTVVLDKSKPVDWSNHVRLNGAAASFTEQECREIQVLVTDSLRALEPLADAAEGLFADALHRYWEGDMGLRYLAAPENETPDEFWDWGRVGGAYNLRFESAEGGWKTAVYLDSEDFPELDAVMREAVRIKEDLYRSILNRAQ